MTSYGVVLERQFAEPHEWWNLYDAWREEEYQNLIAGRTCLDCAKCRRCDEHEDTGFCMEDGEFVYDTYDVATIGCECFEL